MRAIRFSLLVYSLSLLATSAAQSHSVGDITSIAPVPTSTEAPAPSTTEISSSSSSSESTPESTPTPSETSTSSTTETTPTEEPTSSPSTTAAPTTESPETTAATTDAPSTQNTTPTVHIITTVHTVSGTAVPTVFTTTSANTQGATAPDATRAPGLNSDSKDGDSGLSADQKKIIIGVCVGVGGAIVLGAIGVVFWRVAARKRNATHNDEDADLMSGTAVGVGAREKAPSPHGGTPFKSTLDQYHNPGPVNAASNF